MAAHLRQAGAPAVLRRNGVHAHTATWGIDEAGRSRLAIALGIALVVLAGELVAGFLTNSLALLADAAHVATDVAALALALFAASIARRPPSAGRSYGFHRVEVLSALANGVALAGVSIFIVVEAARRLGDPPDVSSGPMLLVASLGLALNVASAALLARGAGGNLNLRGAWLHMVGDTASSAAAVLAGALILGLSWSLADPILSLLISLGIMAGSIRLLRPAVHILLEGTPVDLDMEALRRSVVATEGVLEVHDLHAWAITSGFNAVTAHVVVDGKVPPPEREAVLDRLRHSIPSRFPVRHLTIQLEETGACCEVAHLPGEVTDSGCAEEEHRA